MPKVRFTKDFDFKPTSQTTIGYKAGTEKLITTAAATAAAKAGAGEVIGKAAETKGAADDA
jgi:hypothetical protein